MLSVYDRSEGDPHGIFFSGRVDLGVGSLGVFFVVSCRVVEQLLINFHALFAYVH